jgi:Ca2+-binding RTX toxin-like protein/methionine-rich copper-binding protein CopC
LTDADGIPTTGSGAIRYQWKAEGLDITGATGRLLALTHAQVGKAITVTASYVDGGGTPENVTSSPTALVVAQSITRHEGNPLTGSITGSEGDDEYIGGLAGLTPFGMDALQVVDLRGDAVVTARMVDPSSPYFAAGVRDSAFEFGDGRVVFDVGTTGGYYPNGIQGSRLTFGAGDSQVKVLVHGPAVYAATGITHSTLSLGDGVDDVEVAVNWNTNAWPLTGIANSTLDLGSGDDRLRVTLNNEQLSLSSWAVSGSTVDLGDGRDVMEVRGVNGITGGQVLGGAGDDTLVVQTQQKGLSGTTVSMGAGDDHVALVQSEVGSLSTVNATIDLGDGDDLLEMGRGTATIVGGAGTDTVVLSGSHSDYNVVTGADEVLITGKEDVFTALTLRGVENVSFAGVDGIWLNYFKVNPAGTWLADLTTTDPTDAAPEPTQVALSAVGALAGEILTLSRRGDFQYGVGTNSQGVLFTDTGTPLLARFVDAGGLPVLPATFVGYTTSTQTSGRQTDVPEDFFVVGGITQVQVPQGAVALQFSVNDRFFSDNLDPDNDFGVVIRKADAYTSYADSDLLFGTADADSLNGGLGDDRLYGGAGSDALDGGEQRRVPWLVSTSGDYDRLEYGNTAGITVDLPDRTVVVTAEAGTDSFSGIEEIVGAFNASDMITGRLTESVAEAEFGTSLYLYLQGGSDTIIQQGYGYQQNWADGVLVGYHWSKTGIELDYLGDTATVTYGASGSQSAGVDTLTRVVGIGDTAHDDTFDLSQATINHRGYVTDPVFGRSWHTLLLGRGGSDAVVGNGSTSVHYGSVNHTSNGAGLVLDLREGFADLSNLSNNGVALGTLTFSGVRGVTGTRFNDTLVGGLAANDPFESFRGDGGDDFIDGGSGFDRASYRWSADGIQVQMAAGVVVSVSSGTDILRGIESVQGSMFADVYDARNFWGGGASTASNIGSLNSDLNEFQPEGGDDVIFGNGKTRLDYDNVMVAVRVDLREGVADARLDADKASSAYLTMGRDTFSGVYDVRGSQYDDELIGGNPANGSGAYDGDERFRGNAGNDTIDGGTGFDIAYYDNSPSAAHITLGGLGDGFANDGWGFVDTLREIQEAVGSHFADQLNGSDDNVFESLEGRGGDDTLNGGLGTDRASFVSSPNGAVVDLAAGTAQDGWGGTDTLIGIEWVRGSEHADSIAGSDAGGEAFEPRGGNDTVDGRGGVDQVRYNHAGSGVVVDLLAGTAQDGTGGTDTLINIENVYATNYNDSIVGSDGANVLEGLSGNDTLEGRGGNDTIDGGEGADTARFTGNRNDYALTYAAPAGATPGRLTVTDTVAGRDGTDELTSVEFLRFADVTLAISEGASNPFGMGGHYYEPVRVPTNYSDALAAAALRSYRGLYGYLVVIDGAEENYLIKSFINGNLGQVFWMGISDENSEGQWRITAGPNKNQPASFFDWAQGEPNNSGSLGPEDYAIIGWGSDLKWNDGNNSSRVPAGLSLGYVVEYGGFTPAYSLTSSQSSVSEGSSVKFTIDTTNVEWGSAIAFTVSGLSQADLSSGTLAGTATVEAHGRDGRATITIGLAADQLTEGAETLTITVGGATAVVTVLDSSTGADITPPTVTNFAPTDEATGVAMGTDIVLTFSEPIQRGIGQIVLKTAAGATVYTYDAATSTDLSISGNTFTLNPTSNLAPGTAYKVEFEAGTVQDLAGNLFAGTTEYNFTTSSSFPPAELYLGEVQGRHLHLISPYVTTTGKLYYIIDANNNGYMDVQDHGDLGDHFSHVWLDNVLNGGADRYDTQPNGAVAGVDDARTMIVNGLTLVSPTTAEIVALRQEMNYAPPKAWEFIDGNWMPNVATATRVANDVHHNVSLTSSTIYTNLYDGFYNGVWVAQVLGSMESVQPTLSGIAYHWKSHVLLDQVAVQIIDQAAVSETPTDLFDLRAASFDAAAGKLTVEVWATPTVVAESLDFTVTGPADATLNFTSALGADWTTLSNTLQPGQLTLGAYLSNLSATGLAVPTRIGTLQVQVAAGTTEVQVGFSEVQVGDVAVADLGLALASTVTGADGAYRFQTLPSGSYGLGVSRAAGDGSSGVTSADALAALRLAVGINPNPDPDGAAGPQQALKVSPYQVMAADANHDGKVSAADALAILRMAVKLPTAPAQEWLFVEETRDLWNEAAGQSALTRTNAAWSRAIDVQAPGEVNLVGVLKGDVNGSWTAPAGTQDLDDLQPGYFADLAQRIGAPLDQFGVYSG